MRCSAISSQGMTIYKLLQATGPKVKLIVDPTLIRSPELADRLDYTEVDDQIVGCLHAIFAQQIRMPTLVC